MNGNLSHQMVQRQYAEAMGYIGPEAVARFVVADRRARAIEEAMIVEARQGKRRARPLVRSVGGVLVRLGERLETAGRTARPREYA